MIPRIFHPMLPQDVTLTPFKTYKRYQIDGNNLQDTSSGYFLRHAVYSGKKTPIYAPEANNDPTNSIDGSFQHDVWHWIDAQYYRFPYETHKTLEHANDRFTYKYLGYSASILTIPQHDFGEGIKPGSFELTHSYYNINLRDDGNGNLYDVNVETGSFAPRENLVGYWSSKDFFRKFKTLSGNTKPISEFITTYKSNVFGVDEPSYGKNVAYNINLEGQYSFYFNSLADSSINSGSSYILNEHKDEYNFDGDFTISLNVSTINANFSDVRLLSKRDIVNTLKLGNQQGTINDLQVVTDNISQKYEKKLSSIYPFEFRYSYNNLAYEFECSDGINTDTILISSPNESSIYTIVRSGSMYYGYLNDILEISQSVTVNPKETFNKHCFLIGNVNRRWSAGGVEFGGSAFIDDVRIYNKALNPNQVKTLADTSTMAMYQTAVVGNVFYKRGNVVISSLHPKYHNLLHDPNFTIKYRGTHTIYQHELLTRIDKGDFNLSQNPTALQSYKSDMLIDDMVTGSLFPYVTTIGYYDDDKTLLAVAKLNQPLQMRDDVQMNIIARFDV